MKDIGGQAVIEGVMMRSGNVYTVAVRTPDKDIVLKKENISEMPEFCKKPVLRGVIVLFQALSIGIKALLYSAEASGHEEEKPSSLSLFLTVLTAGVIGIALFLLLPLYSTKMLGISMHSINDSSLVFNLADGLIRIMVFLVYIVSITFIKDIRRVFQYHGAEHQAVHAYEAGVELVPKNVKNYSTLHPRCGTSFLLSVMIISILIFSLIPKDWFFWEKFLSRVVLIPLIAGLSYEYIKYSSKKLDNPLIRTLAMPGLWLQKLTTGTPSSDQIEVAVKALQEVVMTGSENPDKREIRADVIG